jgi:hypothetical protein
VLTGDNRIENNNITDNQPGCASIAATITWANNTVRNTDQLRDRDWQPAEHPARPAPQAISGPVTVKLAGTLTGVNVTPMASSSATTSRLTSTITLWSESPAHIMESGFWRAYQHHHPQRQRLGLAAGRVMRDRCEQPVRNVSASKNGGSGMLVGEGGLISGCSARTNALTGIVFGNGSRVVADLCPATPRVFHRHWGRQRPQC